MRRHECVPPLPLPEDLPFARGGRLLALTTAAVATHATFNACFALGAALPLAAATAAGGASKVRPESDGDAGAETGDVGALFSVINAASERATRQRKYAKTSDIAALGTKAWSVQPAERAR